MYRIPSYILVIAHTSAGYDTHLFVKELVEHFDEIGVIAKNKEESITFSVKVPIDNYIDKEGNGKEKFIELRFSFKFMATSLDLLTRNLVSLRQVLSAFENYSKSQYDLLKRKGIYPYEYMDS